MKLRAGIGLVLFGLLAMGCASRGANAPAAASPVGSATLTSGTAPFVLSDELEKSVGAATPPRPIDTSDPWADTQPERPPVKTWGAEASR